jgi:phosphate transport system substrate-binding protein
MNRLISALILMALSAPVILTAADDDLAVVVNKSRTTDNLTKAQLRKILLGEQLTWPGGKEITVLLRTPGQPEREGVLRSVCSMSEDDFNRYLIHANFVGGSGSPPKSLGSGIAVRQLVISIPGAIGFLRLADVNDAVKVVSVDGVAPGSDGYKVKAGR